MAPANGVQRYQPQAFFLSFADLGFNYLPRYISVRTLLQAPLTVGVTTVSFRIDAEFKR
jgi:hypothetical protein